MSFFCYFSKHRALILLIIGIFNIKDISLLHLMKMKINTNDWIVQKSRSLETMIDELIIQEQSPSIIKSKKQLNIDPYVMSIREISLLMGERFFRNFRDIVANKASDLFISPQEIMKYKEIQNSLYEFAYKHIDKKDYFLSKKNNVWFIFFNLKKDNNSRSFYR